MIMTATMMAIVDAMNQIEIPPEEMSVTSMLSECAANDIDVSKCTDRADLEKILSENRAARG